MRFSAQANRRRHEAPKYTPYINTSDTWLIDPKAQVSTRVTCFLWNLLLLENCSVLSPRLTFHFNGASLRCSDAITTGFPNRYEYGIITTKWISHLRWWWYLGEFMGTAQVKAIGGWWLPARSKVTLSLLLHFFKNYFHSYILQWWPSLAWVLKTWSILSGTYNRVSSHFAVKSWKGERSLRGGRSQENGGGGDVGLDGYRLSAPCHAQWARVARQVRGFVLPSLRPRLSRGARCSSHGHVITELSVLTSLIFWFWEGSVCAEILFTPRCPGFLIAFHIIHKTMF